MASTHWEVVGKSAKKTKNASKTSSKSENKSLIEDMPRIERNGPIKESSTIYDAFAERENVQNQPGKVPDQMNGTSKKPTLRSSSKRIQQTKKLAKGKITLEQGMKLIDVKDLESLLANDKTTFPDSPSIWLKDQASFVNLKLENVPEDDPVFDGKPRDYPLCLLPESCKKLFQNTLKQTPTAVLEIFFEHCIKSLITDVGNDLSLYGFQIFIQLIGHDHPEIIINNLSKYMDLIKLHKNRPLRCLSILWSVGQCGASKLSAGLRVWMDLMLPVLGLRSLTTYAVGYLEQLFAHHKDLSRAFNSVTFRDFFPVLDIVHSGTSTLPTQLQKKLRAAYPKFKVVAFGGKQETSLRSFFPSFLARLKPDGYTPFRQELLSCLIVCLEKDRQCFNLWRQMYTKHMLQSGVLLEHILANWQGVNSKKMDKAMLKETILVFNVTNDGMGSGNETSDGFSVCSDTCKEIITKKLSGFHFPWGSVLMAIFAVLIAILVADFLVNKGFKRSKTAKILEDNGILAFSIQVASHVKTYSLKIYDWLNDNVPVYYSRAVDISYPYLLLIWTKVGVLAACVMETLQPAILAVKEKTPEFIDWVKENFPYDIFETISAYVVTGWEITLHYGYLLWQYVVVYSNFAWQWLLENVFIGKLSPENMQRLLTQGLVAMQENLSTFVLWCNNMITTPSSN